MRKQASGKGMRAEDERGTHTTALTRFVLGDVSLPEGNQQIITYGSIKPSDCIIMLFL